MMIKSCNYPRAKNANTKDDIFVFFHIKSNRKKSMAGLIFMKVWKFVLINEIEQFICNTLAEFNGKLSVQKF